MDEMHRAREWNALRLAHPERTTFGPPARARPAPPPAEDETCACGRVLELACPRCDGGES